MIEVKGVTKVFGNDTAIDYKDLVFETGKSYILLGASGCGKTTLLNMIAGLLVPDSGTVTVDGKNLGAMNRPERDAFRIKNVGYIFQDFKLIEEMSVADNINILKLEGVDTSAAGELMAQLGIDKQKNKKVSKLSGGQKQRVAIVRGLVKHPDIILADEPTGNLNFAVGEQVVKELTAAAKGKTLIVVTHDERLAHYFDVTIDMNEVTGGKYDTGVN